jgi:hypothetical protein
VATPVYSTRFLASPDPTFPPTYTVPEGFVAVVREVDVYCAPSEGGSNCLVQLVDPPCVIYANPSLTAGHTDHLSTRQVFQAGEQLTINSTLGAESSVLVSGYLLTLP